LIKPQIVPSIQSPLGALPARFRRPSLLVVGCGDVGQRVLRDVGARFRVVVLSSSADKAPHFRALGARVVLGNLDEPASLARLSGLARRVLHLAPPPTNSWADQTKDPRTLALVRALRRRGAPDVLVYGSTSGVYGDCAGRWVDESLPAQPRSARAQRRVDAEAAVRFLGRSAGTRVSTLRIPGIYAPDREGGTPRGRLERGSPVLVAADDVYTNHIHADDLARACTLALWRGRAQRCVNVCDDTELKMGDYFDLAADLYGLPRPRRIGREAAEQELPLMQLSFMSESRRLHNKRMKTELGLRLRYPTVASGLVSGA
jgi:nucleoside-diphosphate-sugar epimerase